MDELKMYRHSIAAPKDNDPEYRQWLNNNPAAQRTAAKAEAFDQQLRFGLQQVNVPEGLDERILLHTDLTTRKRRLRRYGLTLAVAASLLMAVQLSWRTEPLPESGFPQLALAHVQKEIQHLEHPAGTVNPALVKALFRQTGAELDGDLGHVTFAFMCPTPDGDALHLIVETEAGPATLLYLPHSSSPIRSGELDTTQFVVTTLPIGANGGMAIVAENNAAARALNQRLTRSVRWSSV